MAYRLFTDVCADLPLEYVRANDLRIVPMPVTVDDRQYTVTLDPDDPSSISTKLFYDMLRSGTKAQSAQIPASTFITAFEPVLMAGGDVLYLAFSSALSGTYNSACLAAQDLMDKYPNRRVVVVDSLCASMGQGLLIHMCVQKRDEGASLDRLEEYMLQNRLRIHHWFTVDDLAHLRRGGRVSGAAAVMGTMLAIKPILHVDEEGKLVPVDKVQGRKRSLTFIADKICSLVDMSLSDTVFISHGDAEADAQKVADMIRARHSVNVLINSVDPVIGCHSGPGTIAVFCANSQGRELSK